MDFELNEEQQAIFDMARDFGAEKIAPFAAQWEKEEAIPRAVLEEAAASDWRQSMCRKRMAARA
jgi:alkylation response protein AidB-like acyl-CoA dehydrogenase